jgi:hemolysin III
MKTYSQELELREEKVNAITHVAGILFGLVSVPFLILNACENCGQYVIAGIVLYGLSFLMVFTFSTIFHLQKEGGRTRHLFKILDHISIYFFIAGTYTPLILIFVNNNFGLTLLAILWTLAIAGTIFKTFYCGRFEIISTIVYLAMGWMLLVGADAFFANMPSTVIWFIIVGAILFTVGVVFYIWRWFVYHHAVWHVFVLAGAICHYVAVLKAV